MRFMSKALYRLWFKNNTNADQYTNVNLAVLIVIDTHHPRLKVPILFLRNNIWILIRDSCEQAKL